MEQHEAFPRAQYRIKEARHSDAEDLNLSGIGKLSPLELAELFKELRQLTKLKSLDLSNNQLQEMPESTGLLTQLKSLGLSHNHLKLIPKSIGQLNKLEYLVLSDNKLKTLPETLGQLSNLSKLSVSNNQLTTLPESFGLLSRLTFLELSNNRLAMLPESLGQLGLLTWLDLSNNLLAALPESLGQIKHLSSLDLSNNQFTTLPESMSKLNKLDSLDLSNNPLNPELAASYKEGLRAVILYLRAKAVNQVVLNEAKLVLIGEGKVGKSCLLGALRGDPWEEGRPTTHGIEIKPVHVTDPTTKSEITLNGWDFGGQRVYRPTHQLFFSSPAVYLVVWEPREGSQQGFVKEWIKLVKYRAPEAKILVVATHGGPGERQPDIDRQELWDLFGKNIVVDFFHVDSRPNERGERRGIDALKNAIARVAASLPDTGRKVPKRWQDVREALKNTDAAYLPVDKVQQLCRQYKMDNAEARLFLTVSHRLGHLIRYEHDLILRDIIVLKPDWLATAISFVFDDKQTRENHGLISFSRLSQLWNDASRETKFRYPVELHSVFLRLMERFDLSYLVSEQSTKGNVDETSLIAQLVPDTRPEPITGWATYNITNDSHQVQICRIVDAQNGQSATAEGLLVQLIVRLHKYSLGRIDYTDSVHWQRGLLLDDNYNGRALMENIGNDIRITVRAPYPERFLSVLTNEVKWLVENYWSGLRCDVMVPCISPCGKNSPGIGLFEVQKLIESKRKNRLDYPCPVCNEWQDIDHLLRNAPSVRRVSVEELLGDYAGVKQELALVHQMMVQHNKNTIGQFDQLNANTQSILSKVDDAITVLIQTFTDEAKDGPRLFSLVPVDRTTFNPKQWVSAKFRLTLWCEHSHLPLPMLNGKESMQGVYDVVLKRDWFKKAAPFMKVLIGTLSLVLPGASSASKLILDDTMYKEIENELDFSKECIEAVLEGGNKAIDWLSKEDSIDIEHGNAIRAKGGTIRELHAMLKVTDPSFGGLVRVLNRRNEFLWVHPQFEKEY